MTLGHRCPGSGATRTACSHRCDNNITTKIDAVLSQIWLRSDAFRNVCMNICTMYTIRNCLYLPGKRPYMLHRKRVRAEMIFHISKAKIRAAMRPPLSLHMQLTEDAGLESRGCAALHGTYYVASSLAALSKIRSSVQDRSVGLRMEATRKRRARGKKKKRGKKKT